MMIMFSLRSRDPVSHRLHFFGLLRIRDLSCPAESRNLGTKQNTTIYHKRPCLAKKERIITRLFPEIS